MKQLILASGSPRRKELLENVKIDFMVKVSDIEEVFEPSLTPAELVQSLAKQKATDIFKHDQEAVVLGSDTVVVYDGKVLGKPNSAEEARDMLRSLSGNKHEVFTGVAILSAEKEQTFYERTDVTFWELTDTEIDDYVKSGEPLDKAGSYGIQQLGSLLVKEITGDYFTVVGLPISRTIRELRKFGIS